MKEVKLNILICKPVEEVFAFTLDSDNTPKYFTSMKQEVASESPARLGTILRNTTDGVNWDEYEIIDYAKNQTFTLSSKNSSYHVRYTFTPKDSDTNFEYYEWVESGELEYPTTIETLELLKNAVEQKEKENARSL